MTTTVSKFISQLWWRFVPGTVFKVRWPRGNIVVDHNHPLWADLGGAVWVDLGFSSDPNDHYRWELEELVGRQGWHWNWQLADNDVIEDLLTIKFVRSREHLVSYFAMKWA